MRHPAVPLLTIMLVLGPVTSPVAAQATPSVAASTAAALERAGFQGHELRGFLDAAAREHGEAGARAARFLVDHMPDEDLRTLDADFLRENLELALQARAEFPWCRRLPEEIFLNDVLPYASLDEPRHPWRAEFYAKAKPIVAGCKTATEAAQRLNAQFFKLVGVHYSRERRRANQSPRESIEQGKASCTGLSIILIDACRAVGVPARAAAIASWVNKRGNHTWVEIWDGGWHFTGADEYDASGLDRAWFTGDASLAQADAWRHAIYASSWKDTRLRFPLVWSRGESRVPAVNVTGRYARQDPAAGGAASVGVRVLERPGGDRIEVVLRLLDPAHEELARNQSRSGRADWNDLAVFQLEPGLDYELELGLGEERRTVPMRAGAAGWEVRELVWSELSPAGLSREEAAAALERLWNARCEKLRAERNKELEARAITIGSQVLRLKERRFGDAPKGGHALFISLHGGGGAPKAVNDQQWENQIKLYEPKEGWYVAPRAPTDTWNLWHQGHIDPLFDRLIGDFVVARGVDPDRVYLLGYSAGGDGVYQLAPRMADRFAAASMMAGHPNEASPLGLRNLPFAIFMGGKDAAYNRNRVARQWGDRLAELADADEGGYPHWVKIYGGLGHWMKRKDAEAVPWMSAQTRSPWPERVVWYQDDVTNDRFYWLALPTGTARGGQEIRAEVKGQKITVATKGAKSVILRLADALLDLDQPVEVVLNGKPVFAGRVTRSLDALRRSLVERADPRTAASATLTVTEP